MKNENDLIDQLPFQFHTGSIKRMKRQQISAQRSCFNSILVRLKEADVQTIANEMCGFNSILVRLKEFNDDAVKYVHSRFNSILVRLKEYNYRIVRISDAVSIPYWFD